MENKTGQKNTAPIQAALISGVFTIITACISGLFTIILALPEFQKLSIPTEVITFITIVLSIIVVSAVLIIAITSYVRNQTRQANTATARLVEKENVLLQEIETETTSLISEKV